MKVILIANLSANGQVLLVENPVHETPQEALGISYNRPFLKETSSSEEKPSKRFDNFRVV
ncbi:hypothetical protein FW781_04565 (plasmid) [Chryseobacterium panacisoli]|uniref:Uncharacterized protein n=1 Tax=Chryseobacterium panacisoli TaxID=1807141 RepID=A0A5D8ZY61_9FLAO|nr:hypothetical protein [Chryseobacterium panacisoli]TZF99203.1 hypothetical protein FW781_04565 [Chryseobacterium panacisoli]